MSATGTAGTPSMDVVSVQGITGGTPVPVRETASAVGGVNMTRYFNLGITGQVAKASPGKLYGWIVSNAAAAVRYLKIYNKSTAGLASDAPVATILLPATSTSAFQIPAGIDFSAGISVRATQLIADNDATAPTANDVTAEILWS